MQLVDWINNDKLNGAEIHGINIDRELLVGLSDRLNVVSIGQDVFRSFIIEQDWTQQHQQLDNGRRSGTFILHDNEMTMSTPSNIRSVTPMKSMSRPVSRSKIPSATTSRRSLGMDSSFTNGSPMSTSMSMSLTCSEDLAQAVRQLEDTISPLARANSQIRDSISQLEKSLLALKSAATSETNSD